MERINSKKLQIQKAKERYYFNIENQKKHSAEKIKNFFENVNKFEENKNKQLGELHKRLLLHQIRIDEALENMDKI